MADPVDPAFEGLFRPGPPATSPAADQPESVTSLQPASPSEFDSNDASPLSPAGARLYRSQGVLGHGESVLAIPIGSRLRTLSRTSAEPDDLPVGGVATITPERPEEIDAVAVVAVTSAAPATGDPAPAPSLAATLGAARGGTALDDDGVDDAGSMLGRMVIPGFAAWLIIGVGTLLVAFVNAIVGGGSLGWPTGLTLLLTTIYCALVVRRRDLGIAIFAPPLIYLLAALTAGQIFLGANAGGLVGRSAALFFSLGANWGWILGSVLGAVIVAVIRRITRR